MPDVRLPKVREDGDVRCSKCGEYHPPQRFSRSPSGKYMAWCKPCMAQHNREARQRLREAA